MLPKRSKTEFCRSLCKELWARIVKRKLSAQSIISLSGRHIESYFEYVKHTEIDLNAPFEKSLAAALSLPRGGDARDHEDEAVAEALRYLYTVAHGRIVQTLLGPISIAPAIDPSLKDAPLRLETRNQLFMLAERRTNFTRPVKEQVSAKNADESSVLLQFCRGQLGSPETWPSPRCKIDNARGSRSLR